MKFVLLLAFSFLSMSIHSATSFTESYEVEALYEQSSVPDFTPWIGIALPGRCFYNSLDNTKTATVLIPSQLEEGLSIAPLTADMRKVTFFDKMTYSEILRRFPQSSHLYRLVQFNAEEAILSKSEGKNEFSASIRETKDNFLVKVILKKHIVRFCYYNKR